MRLKDFECPNCGANEMVEGEDRRLICVFCGSSFGEVARICPRCGHYNESGVRHCAECGTQLIRDCPACGADNWTVADHCIRCGRNLDMIDQMARRWQQSTQQMLYERQTRMTALKEEEERASQERMATMMEAERRRQEALALAREAQKQRDQQIYMWIGVAVVAIVIIMVLVLLLTSGGA